MSSNLLIIDGSYGEGGGQILRTSLSLSSILNRPIKIINIRAGREKPGLRPQHLTAVNSVTKITNAIVKGNEIGSTELYFEPKEIQSGEYTFDTGTAGSTSLVFQTLLPILIFGKDKSNLTLIGGTHVPMSPSYNYLCDVFLPAIASIGIDSKLNIKRWGFYPKGGGQVLAEINPLSKNQNLTSNSNSGKNLQLINRGNLKSIKVTSAVANISLDIAHRENKESERLLRNAGYNALFDAISVSSIGQGNAMFLLAEFDSAENPGLTTRVGFASLGERGKKAEKVADDCVRGFIEFMKSSAVVDSKLADQLLIYIALASISPNLKFINAFTTNKSTEHLKTNAWLIEKFLLIKFEISEKENCVTVLSHTIH